MLHWAYAAKYLASLPTTDKKKENCRFRIPHVKGDLKKVVKEQILKVM
jgi:hypothetical protein